MAKWNDLLSQGCDDIRQLQEQLHISPEQMQLMCEIQDKFPMFVNPYYLSLADAYDSEDPIRKMCIPSASELQTGGHEDTSGEQSNTVLPGVQHKYAQTALILSTNVCAMYCRHCFRKRMVGLDSGETVRRLDDITAYIREHTEIDNVLISGGDAFLNSNEVIENYLQAFTAIGHLNLIRFGTRTPVVLPQRISEDPELLDILARYAAKKQIYVVTQVNHPKEVTPELRKAVRLLLQAGIVVKNQTVLLKGVNDTPEVLSELIKSIVSAGIVPYYIFQCRPVKGVQNQFQVPLHRALRIVEAAKAAQDGQGKCFRYVMSHVTGKIEILGDLGDGRMLFKYHQAKDPANLGKIFTMYVEEDQCWPPAELTPQPL